MTKRALGTLLAAALMACGGGQGPSGDANSAAAPSCNPIAQIGCAGGEKCTWIVDIDQSETADQVGHTGCAPAGPTRDGEACTDALADANDGADTCIEGDLCVGGKCKPICDTQLVSGSGAGACRAGFSCVSYRAVFESAGNPTAGVCEPACDPLTQRLKLGGDEACGSADAARPSDTCAPVDDEFKAFACAPTLRDSLAATDRRPPALGPDGTVFLNSCAPGYVAMYLEDLSGTMKVVCSGMCAPVKVDKDIAAMPGNAKLNQGDVNALGKLVSDPKPVAGHATCAADIKGSEANEDCRFLWLPLATRINNSRKPVNSSYNNTLGICFAFAHYIAIDTNNDGVADAPERSCSQLPRVAPPSTDPGAPFGTAEDAGCYPLTLAPAPPVAANPHRVVQVRLSNGAGRAVRHVFD
jgi:hypothetical protein